MQDYVKNYLGESAKTAQFAKEFLEKRSAHKKRRGVQRYDDEVGCVLSVTYLLCKTVLIHATIKTPLNHQFILNDSSYVLYRFLS